MQRILTRPLAGLFIAFTLLCGSVASPALAQDKSLTVFAAASMKNALDELEPPIPPKTGVKVTASYAASSVLAKQIEQGAPADIFVSADTDVDGFMRLPRNPSTSQRRTNLLGNSIVLIAPKDSSVTNVTIGQGFDLAKLAGAGKIATRRCEPRFRSANTPKRRWKSLAAGTPRRRNSRWPRACAPH
ncbi:MAG: substrate-binding domain-containing protein [Bradyrhizobium sp.]